ncbi:dephospho-CoA kinase [Candidatus Vallotiella sp. (ex Adelges kitamiensis)]|uniref:dephospho-CoA kinase n=1 Tax=Candidatus Vallotiella sp. (ex Adelges kitamiensis) TaxID=2864217 RepID=UPI001CE2A1BC|nr:dephospho-CoA kinase [Candidatus Vallotia sp. (ex Adelges kitamiensis)]
MFTVGLTGGIGSGKTTVANAFAAYGVPIVDTDLIAHRMTASGGAAIPRIQRRFGSTFITAEGTLDRARMRELVFRNTEAKRQLEAIMHPLIRIETDRAIQAGSSPYAICVVPLLIEVDNWRERVDRFLVVDCSVQTQIKNVMQRNGFTRKQVQAIIAHQATRQTRLAAADDILVNETDIIDPLLLKIKLLHQRYLCLARYTIPS